MSMSRALAPLRRAHTLRHRGPSIFSIFERDPFFAGLAPIFNQEFAPLQRYNYPRVDIKEGPKAYHVEAEVPGFRKDDINIEFLDNRTLRISGRRAGPVKESHETTTEATDAAGEQTSEASADWVESKAPASESAEPTEVEPLNKSTDVVEAADNEYEMVESERQEEFSFSRQWRLPEGIDQEAVRASLDHGILKVTLPKMKAESARKIQID
jgi:HSP20 family molecular chaperone IbpA